MKNILIIGGDMRFITVANMFSEDGFDVAVYGFKKSASFNKEISFPVTLEEAIEKCDAAVLPLPVTKNQITVSAPFGTNEIYIDDLLSLMGKKPIFCGMASREFKDSAKKFGVRLIDYFESEYLTVLNCVPTTEGAISIAIENTPFTLFGSKVLVLGFGRVGRHLSKTLCALGADTFVEARKVSDLAWISALGYGKVPLDTLNERLWEFDIIFNTVPKVILTADRLARLKKNCVIIDLASYPYGADVNFCRENKIKYILASSLPGKFAPQYAGKIIKETVCNMLIEEVQKNEI